MRKKIEQGILRFICLILIFISLSGLAQTPGEWTWMHGSTTPNSAGVFGTQGVPNPANTPPALYEPCEWKDNNGNFWLFGGMRTTASWDRCNALWKYDVATNQWTWMKGSSFPGAPGVYGVKGVPAATNTPGGRLYGVASWTDATGDLWLFGGQDNAIGFGPLNDLWRYNIASNQWTWMGGSSVAVSVPDVVGTQGVPSATTWPGGRSESTGLGTDNAGNLWLYSGSLSFGGGSDNLWKYDVGTNQWTWMKGANTFGTAAVYGTQGISAIANTPGAMLPYASWTDINGDLWFFGGQRPDNMLTLYTNALWKYTIATNQWTWMKGPNTTNNAGNYGTKCVSATTNNPPARWENRARVKDACGNFWNFGGLTTNAAGPFNDLWHYTVSSNQWTWISGSNLQSQTAVFGTKGVSAPSNQPGGRYGGVSWIDNNGYIYIFGGFGISVLETHNDLFRYVPPSAYNKTQVNSTTCNPCNGSATINFTCALPNYSYVWSNGSSTLNSTINSNTLTGLCAGSYTVTITSSCSQTQTTTFTISGSACGGINANVNSATLCSGTTPCPTLSAVGTSGTPPYTYLWSTTATNSSISPCPVSTSIYTVTITDSGGLTATSTAAITVNPAVVVTITPTNINCNTGGTGSGIGSASASGGSGTSPYTYNWSNGQSMQTATGLTSGNYTVTITDSKGCTSTSTTTITSPLPLSGQFTKGIANCNSCGCKEWIMVNATGGTSPYTYTWPDGYANRYKNQLCPGSYSLNITDKNGCSANINLTVP